MVEAGIAVKLNNSIFYNQEGKECIESEAYGQRYYYCLIYPDYLLFFNEYGTNLKGNKNSNYMVRSSSKQKV